MVATAAEFADLDLPPHSVEAEQCVLGGLMLDNAAWDRMADVMGEGDFYRADHRVIYRHITRLIEAGKPVDPVTLAESLESTKDLERAGGMEYLSALAANTPSAANIRRYAEIVRERAVLRHLAEAAAEIQTMACKPMGRSASEIIDEAEARILAVSERGARGRFGLQPLAPTLARTVERVDLLYNRDGGDIIGTPTGFTDLDRKTSGLQDGDLIIVAGRPAMGKSSLACNIAEHVAVVLKKPVAVFTLEMASAQLALRWIGSIGRIDQTRLRTGRLQESDWERLTEAVSKLNGAPIHIDESASLTPMELRARARRMLREHKSLGLIVVDYVGLMSGEGENRVQQIGAISRALKGLAREINCPVMALSQLNRSLEQRADKRPQLSDLRESGDLEQDADLVLMLYREEEYDPDSDAKGTAEVLIRKHRNGETGMVRLTFLKPYTRFENYAGAEITTVRRGRFATGFDAKKAAAGDQS